MSQPCREMDMPIDEWAIATVELDSSHVPQPRRAPLLVELPCPRPATCEPAPNDFDCEVMQTAELARYLSVSPCNMRARARRYAWGVALSGVVAVGTITVPVTIWLGAVPLAFGAALGWQWAVLRAAAKRLERGSSCA